MYWRGVEGGTVLSHHCLSLPNIHEGPAQAKLIILICGSKNTNEWENTRRGPKEFVPLHLRDTHIRQEVLGAGCEMGGGCNQPLQHRIRVDLKHPGHRTDAQPFRQCPPAQANRSDETRLLCNGVPWVS